MAARVQVVVEAKDASSGVLRGITSQLGGLGRIVEDVTGKNVAWGNVAVQATEMVINGVKDAINVSREYASEVRDVALAGDIQAESASRLIQVLDDYEITTDDILTATKALTKQGLEPSIETIASLADQYVTINSAQEKNEFIIKNLGRAGLQWANALSQGGAALRELNSEVDANLILTSANVAEAEEYRLALDEWNDAVMGLKVSVGSQLLPVLTSLVSEKQQLHTATEALNEADKTGGVIMATSAEQAEKLREAHAAQLEILPSAINSYQDWAEAIGSSVPELQSAEETTKLFNAEMGTLKDILKGDLGDAQDDYNAKMEEYNKQLSLARTQKEKDEINTNIAAETAEYNKRAMAIAFNIQQEAILNSTLPNEDKIAMITSLGQSYGMYDEATANAIMTTQDWITDVEDGTMAVEDATQRMRLFGMGLRETSTPARFFGDMMDHVEGRSYEAVEAMNEAKIEAAGLGNTILATAAPAVHDLVSGLARLPATGTEWNYAINIIRTGSAGGPSLPNQLQEYRQTGGEVYAQNPYWVGEGGREPFIPAQNGRILGHAESMHALANGMGGGGGGFGPFYGNVTISTSSENVSSILSMR